MSSEFLKSKYLKYFPLELIKKRDKARELNKQLKKAVKEYSLARKQWMKEFVKNNANAFTEKKINGVYQYIIDDSKIRKVDFNTKDKEKDSEINNAIAILKDIMV